MNGASVQRFAILLVLFGGILHLTGAVENNYLGLPSYGMPIVFLALLLGVIGLIQENDEWR